MSCFNISKVLVQNFLQNDLPQLNPNKCCLLLRCSPSSNSTALREGGGVGGKEGGREGWEGGSEEKHMGGRKVQREILLSANSLLKILIPLKASKECFFPLE